MTMDSPEYQTMKKIVHSSAGQKAALDATNAGRPALNGVDPLLRAALDNSYSQENLGPLNAAYEVAAVMRESTDTTKIMWIGRTTLYRALQTEPT
jgi:hypothetical protein